MELGGVVRRVCCNGGVGRLSAVTSASVSNRVGIGGTGTYRSVSSGNRRSGYSSQCRGISTSQVVHGAKQMSSADYCADVVRKNDYEMFLCTILLPNPEVRTKVMAIRAFNTEIALVRDQVSQKETGLARLAFWRDSVNKLFEKRAQGVVELLGDVPRQPTVLELSRVILEKGVSKKWFMNLLDGREKIMTDSPFNTVAELEAYCDQTVTPILYMSFEMLGVKNLEVDHAASHLGKAIGLTTFVRSIPHNAQKRRVLIPQELLVKHGVSQEQFIRYKDKEKLREVIYDISSHAHTHYAKAKAMKKGIDKLALPMFLSGVPSEIYLKRLQRVNFDPYDSSLTKRYGLLPWHLFSKKITKSFF